jgi:type IV secretion system protein VirD4
MSRERASQQELAVAIVLGVLALMAAVAIAATWSLPVLIAWAHSGHFAHLRVLDGLKAVIGGRLYGADPASAYPPPVARLMPGAWGFWSTLGLVLIAVTAGLGAVGRVIEIRMSRPAADRRWWQLRGRRPHEFGRWRTVSDLVVDAPVPDRVIVGRFARPAALLAIDGAKQIAVIAAPRTGKSSGLVIPAVLEHAGPTVTSSVKTDVVIPTIARRRRLGRVFVWDPFGPQTDCWDALQGCEDWGHALLVARWLGHAQKLGQTSNQEYFDEEAEGLTAPLLHAAALAGDVSAADVYRWILVREQDAPEAILKNVGADDALSRLQAVYGYTERQRDGIIGTAAVQLKAYGHPAAARTATRGQGLTPEALFESDAGHSTLYVVAGREHQQILAPLVVTMISSLLFWLSERENRTGQGLWPPALFALDETANIAPLQDLPQILATSLSSGARFMTVWHSVAQLRRHFGVDAAAEILALCQAKVFMGSVTDHYTRQEIVELLGQRQQINDQQGVGRGADVMSAQVLQRTSSGEGLLIHGDVPPVFFRQRRHYEDRDLRVLKGEPPGTRAAQLAGRPGGVGSPQRSA